MFTCLAADKVGDSGRGLAFEVSPREFLELFENVRIGGYNVFMFSMGLGDEESVVSLIVSGEEHSGGNHVARTFAEAGVAIGVLPFDSTPLFKKIIGERSVVVKIDVEGYEMKVLRGMKNLLYTNRVRKIIVEIDYDYLEAYGDSAEELKSFIMGLGYVGTVDESGLRHFDQVFVKEAT